MDGWVGDAEEKRSKVRLLKTSHLSSREKVPTGRYSGYI